MAWALPRERNGTEAGYAARDYVTRPVTYPANVPGCDEVEPPPTRGFEIGWTAYGASHGYDDPDFPWLTAEKATAMSDALGAALPADVEVRFDAPERMLRFQPIFHRTFDELPDTVDPADLDGDSDAHAVIVRAGSTGTLRAAVRAWDGPPPVCVAGDLDERRTVQDGTVVDVLDTWSEYRGERTLTRAATAYPPDGSRVRVVVDDASGTAHTGALPLTVDELVSIVSDPRLRTTTAVPAGTPPARSGCGFGVEPMGDPLDRADVDRLNTALTAAWDALGPLPVTADRPIGSLEITSSARDAACVDLRLSESAGDAELGVTIAVDTSAPEEPAQIRPDGTRVRVGRADGRDHVAVSRPSGTAVFVTLTGVGFTADQLVVLATAPGLDL